MPELSARAAAIAAFLFLAKTLPPRPYLLAFASLPDWARRLYGIPSPPLTDAAVTAALRAAHQSTTRLPVLVPGAVQARRLMRAAA